MACPAQFSSIAGGWILSNSENPYAHDPVSRRFHASSVDFETASLFTGLTAAVISSTYPVQDGMSALGQAHTRLFTSQEFPHVALGTVPVSACLPDSNSPKLVLQSNSVEFSSFAQTWLDLGTRESPLCAPPRLSVFCTRVATFGAASSWACWSGGQWPGPVRSCRRQTLSRGPTGKRGFAVLGFVPAGIWHSPPPPLARPSPRPRLYVRWNDVIADISI